MCFTVNRHKFERSLYIQKLNCTNERKAFKREKKKLKTNNTAKVTVKVLFT